MINWQDPDYQSAGEAVDNLVNSSGSQRVPRSLLCAREVC